MLTYVEPARRRRQRDHHPTDRLDRQGAGRAPRPAARAGRRTASLIPKAIEEILRYEAPSPVQARYVAQDVEHHGQTVPEGSVMLLLNGSANRDERRFPTATASTSTARSAST